MDNNIQNEADIGIPRRDSTHVVLSQSWWSRGDIASDSSSSIDTTIDWRITSLQKWDKSIKNRRFIFGCSDVLVVSATWDYHHRLRSWEPYWRYDNESFKPDRDSDGTLIASDRKINLTRTSRSGIGQRFRLTPFFDLEREYVEIIFPPAGHFLNVR